MNYKSMTVEDIINWCQENNQVEWLKNTMKKTTFIFNEEGEILKERKITFIELKLEFTKTFMPEIAPKTKPKKKTMYELVEAL